MDRNRLRALHGEYQRWSASFVARGLGIALILAVGIAMHLVNETFGLPGVFRFAGLVFVLMSPIAGLDAWLGSVRRGKRVAAWARAIFWAAAWVGGLYVLLNAETVSALVDAGTGLTAP